MLSNKLNILYEDAHLIVVLKPAGTPVQTKNLSTPDLESMLKNHIARSQKPGTKMPPYLAVIHRLDQPVRGILVFAKTKAAAKGLNAQLQKDHFGKHYQAVLCGTLPHSGTLTDYLVKDGRTNSSRVCKKEEADAKLAELSYEILDTNEAGLSIAKILLKTGRHHQIRVQMAHAGAPLWGDNKYNPEFVSKKGYHTVALCAYRLTFTHPITNKPMEFEIPCDWDCF